MNWTDRIFGEQKYKRRKLQHEPDVSLEYGEKTWTTEQTVRDLLQNHLDAETEKYYNLLVSTLCDVNKIETFFELHPTSKEKFEDFMYALFLYCQHGSKLSEAAQVDSLVYMEEIGEELCTIGFPFKYGYFIEEDSQFEPGKKNLSFQLDKFTSLTFESKIGLPKISFKVVDTVEKREIGFVEYEDLKIDKKYAERISNGNFRYQIIGTKILDNGGGYDVELGIDFISTKSGKRHLRGKFGEGGKMSLLHLLRNGADVKLRSAHNYTKGGSVLSRAWQFRPKVTREKISSEGVEIENDTPTQQTGSMTYIDLRKAKPEFRKTFLENVDPRTKGLGQNIVEYSPVNFVYPLSTDNRFFAGVDTTHNGEIQYVQGLRVPQEKKDMGYTRPWFSYNIMDSKVITGRDRNELKGLVEERIGAFWYYCDNHILWDKIVSKIMNEKNEKISPEMEATNKILEFNDSGKVSITYDDGNKVKGVETAYCGIQRKIIVNAFEKYLRLEKEAPYLLMTQSEYDAEHLEDLRYYAEGQGIRIKIIKGSLNTYAKKGLEDGLRERGYDIHSIRSLMEEMKKQNDDDDGHEEEPEQDEYESREKVAAKAHFESAVVNVKTLARQLNLPELDFTLKVDETSPEPIRRSGNKFGYGTRYDDDFMEEMMEDMHYEDIYGDGRRPTAKRNEAEVIVNCYGKTAHVTISTSKLFGWGADFNNPEIQRKIELFLLGAYVGHGNKGHETNRTEMLKRSQNVLDDMIEKLVATHPDLEHLRTIRFNHKEDPEYQQRVYAELLKHTEINTIFETQLHLIYLRAIDNNFRFEEIQDIFANQLANFPKEFTKKIESIRKIVCRRVWNDGSVVRYFNDTTSQWITETFTDLKPIHMWQDMPVYKLKNGNFLIDCPAMSEGSVLVHKEGKDRSVTMVHDNKMLRVQDSKVEYADFNTSGDQRMSVHPGSLLLSHQGVHAEHKHIDDQTYLKTQLSQYKFYATGEKLEERKIIEGVRETVLPIEYGKDEWDNPIRVFQDIIQNHVDATQNKVKLVYEIERDGKRIWVHEEVLTESDEITGFAVMDDGDGYYPDKIARLGESSKKSPLFAGKYGEGQKMVAAAALRNGLELVYQSTIEDGGELKTWQAVLFAKDKEVIKSGKVSNEKKVAFNVNGVQAQNTTGSLSMIRLPEGVSSKDWKIWVKVLDPREKFGVDGGMARYVRQLQENNKERKTVVGPVTILWDRQGELYENGLRINPGRKLSFSQLPFGLDVPDIVNTRERNAFSEYKLKNYLNFALSQSDDEELIRFILVGLRDGKISSDVVRLEDFLGGEWSHQDKNNKFYLWSKIAKEVWRGVLIHMNGAGGARVQANMVHLDKTKIVQVPKSAYNTLKLMLPTVESTIERMSNAKVNISQNTREKLARIVSELFTIAKKVLSKVGPPTPKHIIDKITQMLVEIESVWSNSNTLVARDLVSVAPITSAFHGLADKGIVFNEHMIAEEDLTKLLHTTLHELCHIITGYSDYTEEFVTLLHAIVQGFQDGESRTY